MAQDLGGARQASVHRDDVTSEHVVELCWEESEHDGPDAVERTARRLLVRELHRALPKGWLASPITDQRARVRAGAADLSMAATVWAHSVGRAYKTAAYRVFGAMLEAVQAGRIPAGWLPANADDPFLLDLFQRFWHASR